MLPECVCVSGERGGWSERLFRNEGGGVKLDTVNLLQSERMQSTRELGSSNYRMSILEHLRDHLT